MHYIIRKSKYPSIKTDGDYDINLLISRNFSISTHESGNPALSLHVGPTEQRELQFGNKEERDRALKELIDFVDQNNQTNSIVSTNPAKQIFADIKDFIVKYRFVIYIAGSILLIDHVFLGGKILEKIRGLIGKSR